MSSQPKLFPSDDIHCSSPPSVSKCSMMNDGSCLENTSSSTFRMLRLSPKKQLSQLATTPINSSHATRTDCTYYNNHEVVLPSMDRNVVYPNDSMMRQYQEHQEEEKQHQQKQQDLLEGSEDTNKTMMSSPPSPPSTSMTRQVSEDDTATDPAEESDDSNDVMTDEERRIQEENESIALARMMMAEEALASHRMSADFLRENSEHFSSEDFEALQAALEEEDHYMAYGEDDIPEHHQEDLSYETLLELGERIGDVKADRWALLAKKEIAKLETFCYNPDQTAPQESCCAHQKQYDNDSEMKCLVCQFPYEKGETLRRLPCGHCFHADCVDQWLMGKDFCPYCRQTISSQRKE